MMGLLAQLDPAERVRGLRDAFSHGPEDRAKIPYEILAMIAAFALVLLVINVARRLQREGVFRRERSTAWLMNICLKRLGVGLLDRALLRRVARAAGFDSPLLMFFSPALYQKALQRWRDDGKIALVRAYVTRRLGRLAPLLFKPLVPRTVEAE